MYFEFIEDVCDACAKDNNWFREIIVILEKRFGSALINRGEEFERVRDEYWESKKDKCVKLSVGANFCKKHIEQMLEQFPGD